MRLPVLLLALSFTAAAHAGDTPATTPIYQGDNFEVNMLSDFEAGTRFYDAGNIEMAITMFRQGADKGDQNAQFALGTYYYFGEGIAQDFAQAHALFELAAKQGDLPSEFFLGQMHARGEGMPVDAAAAVRHFERAANGCLGHAQSALALQLHTGEGIAQDDVAAVAWLDIATRGGNEEAASVVESMRAQLDDAGRKALAGRTREIEQGLECPKE